MALQPRYSLVIPAYNEEMLLPRLLDSVEVAVRRYSGDARDIEVVVADNASTDRTAEIASARGCRVVRVEKRMIAAARNGGAAEAGGQVICFVDADSRVHPDTFNVIDAKMKDGATVGGATGWKLERKSAGIGTTVVLVWLAVSIARVNTGVVFCRADAFRAIGGYDESLHFAEDVKFFRAMRRWGNRHGMRTVRKTDAPVTVSARKMDKHGEWHMLYMLFWIPLRYGSLEKLARAYWYEDR